MFDPQAGPTRDTHLYFNANQGLAAIRQGDWKLFLNTPDDPNEAKSAKEDANKSPKGGKAKKGHGDQSGLYNLSTDPGESKDVSAEQPDIVAKLQSEAKQRNAEIHKNKRPAGQLENAK
jgi:arylsulfatase A-like enzyme